VCGILGYYHLRRQPVDRSEAEVTRLRDLMQHRGPDSCGYLEATDRSWILAHRRLSIIDLSAAGHQPMTGPGASVHISYNGEIYNYRELRDELARAGHHFISTSDTEVLLHLYAREGEKSFARLRGMFAMILVDESRGCAFIVRDPVGKKPLYYALFGETVMIASDPGVIARDRDYRKGVSATGLYSLLTMGGVKSPDTLFEGIRKLEPGCYHMLDAGFKADQPSIRYFEFDVHPHASLGNGSDPTDALDALLDRAVERRMLSDVPFGVYLSGGIDSALIVSYMARHVDRVRTFSIDMASSSQAKREADAATRVAKQFATDHQVVQISDDEYIEILDQVLLTSSGPAMPDAALIAKLSQLARANGVIVIETGEGADELFLGYQDYLAYLNHGYHALSNGGVRVPALAARVASALGPATAGSKLAYLADSIDMRGRRAIMSDFLYQPFFSYQALRIAQDYLHRPVPATKFNMLNDVLATRVDDYRRYAPSTLSFLWNSSYRWADFLLDRIDRFTMTSGVEGRAPFLDVDVINFGLSLGDEWKSRNGTSKYVLRKLAERRISGEHASLPKRGFGGGNDNMLGDNVCSFLRDRLSRSPSYRESPLLETARIATRSQLFTVASFHAWADTWM